MNNNNIEIKAQQKNWFTKGVIYLILMLTSLLIALLPLMVNCGKETQIFLHIFGSIIFIPFAILFSILIYNEFYPKTAMKLTARGFIDINNIGDDIEVEWTNVSAVKMLGKENMPFLGITLENTDIVVARMKKNKADEIIENIEQNLPTILIAQNTVRISIKELKAIFIKFVREARLLETEPPKKQKNNPFTTDDVLRAFGQLPKKPKNEADEESNIDTENSEPAQVNADSAVKNNLNDDKTDTIIYGNNTDDEPSTLKTTAPEDEPTTALSDEPVVEPISEPVEEPVISSSVQNPFTLPDELPTSKSGENQQYVSASDSFYEALRAKVLTKKEADANAPLDTEKVYIPAVDNKYDDNTNNISPEIEELLAGAKSSRITEIEKLLSNDEVPYSISRENKVYTEEPPAEADTANEVTTINEPDSQDTKPENADFGGNDNQAEPAEDIDSDAVIDQAEDNALLTAKDDIAEPITINDTTNGGVDEPIISEPIIGLNDDNGADNDTFEPMIEIKLDDMFNEAVKDEPAAPNPLAGIQDVVDDHDTNADTREFILNLSKALKSTTEDNNE